MKYIYNQNDYGNVKYDNPTTSKIETIKTSGCGVVSCCMVVNNLMNKEKYTVSQMADFAVKSKARDNNGTNMITLLNAICKENKELSYTTTTDETKLINHLKAGGLAIVNQGDSYNVFSTAGHFVVASNMSSNNIEVVDAQMYSGKYDVAPRPSRIIKKTTHGCIVTKEEIGKATSDRNPAYFLISYNGKKTTTTSKTPTFTVGKTYTLQYDMVVRTGAGTKYSQKKKSQLTADGQKNALNQTLAALKKGTKITVKKVVKSGNEIWLEIPSGYIAAYCNSTTFIK